MRFLRKINWLNTLFLTITPLVGVVGTGYLIQHNAVYSQTLILAGVMSILTGLAITCGYHRLFSHKTYRAHWSVRLLFTLLGGATFEGSVQEWCTDHRNHHRYTDTDRDPYNAKRGFWYSHITWLFTLDVKKRDFSNVKDLQEDPITYYQHKFYVPTAILVSFIIPMAIAALWGDVLGAFIIAGALRITFNQHITFCINSVCHIFGNRPYSDRNTAKDNAFTALFTFGEGYHNFHHKFPLDYRNGIRFYDFDPSKWLIRAFAALGLASHLKRISFQRIVRARIAMDEQRLTNKTISNATELVQNRIKPLVDNARESLLQALNKFEELENAYLTLKKQRLDYVNGKLHEYRESLQKYKASLKESKRQIKYSLQVWTQLISNPTQFAM